MASELPDANLSALLGSDLKQTPFEFRKILLEKKQNVFAEPTVSLLRNWAATKKIVVFDGHGVVFHRSYETPNPHALAVLKTLRSRGFTPVFWSFGLAEATKRRLEQHELWNLFDLSIFQEKLPFYRA